jgi:hypothetical protein
MFAAAASVALGWSGVARADDSPNKEVSGDHAPTKWVASWTTAAQGVLNSQPGSPAPNLSFSLPDFSVGAQEQTLRLIIKPDLWGN